jgi:hypothetical protein
MPSIPPALPLLMLLLLMCALALPPAAVLKTALIAQDRVKLALPCPLGWH